MNPSSRDYPMSGSTTGAILCHYMTLNDSVRGTITPYIRVWESLVIRGFWEPQTGVRISLPELRKSSKDSLAIDRKTGIMSSAIVFTKKELEGSNG